MNDPRFRHRHRLRRQRLQHQRYHLNINWFLLGITLIAWVVFGFIVFQVEPSLIKDIPAANLYGPFFIVLLLSIFFLVLLISKSWKQAVLISIVVTFILMLRLHHLDTLLNWLLVISITLLVEFLWIHPLTKPKSIEKTSDDMVESKSIKDHKDHE